MNAPSLHAIAKAMGGEVRGKRACFPTPGHSKRDRGSWASLEPGAPDGVLIHCSNGGDPLAVKDILRDAGILPPLGARNDNTPWSPPKRESSPSGEHACRLEAGQRIAATFDYFDQHGELLYRKHRIEPGSEGRSKSFSYDRPRPSGGWQMGAGDDRVPYRLPDLIAAPRDVPIYMAEGEAKADKLASWGLLATSLKDWKGFEFSGYVKGRRVIILPDNDDTGRTQAEKVRKDVETAEGDVLVLELPGLPPGGDIIDWSGNVEELHRLVEQAGQDLCDLDDAADWADIEVPPRRWLIDGWLPIGECGLLTGAGSVGKSLVSQQLAVMVSAGEAFLGTQAVDVPSIYITCEDGTEEIQRRHKAIAHNLKLKPGACLVKSWKGEIDLELAVFDAERRMKPTKRFQALRRTVLARGAKLLVLDNTSHLFGGDENKKREVAAFVNLLNGLAAEMDGVVLLLGHPNKTGLNNPSAGDANQFGGSVAWENQVRSRMFMEAPNKEDPDARALTNPKANYSSKGNRLEFRWFAGAFVLDSELPTDYAAELASTIKVQGENEAYRRCLRAATERKKAVSDNPGTNYFAKVFVEMPEGKGFTRAALERAHQRLLALGEIELDAKLWQRENRAWKYGIKLVEKCTDPPHRPAAPTSTAPSVNSARTDPLIDKSISGAALGAAAPSDGGDCQGCGGIGCKWCEG